MSTHVADTTPISTGAAFLNGRGSDHAISIPVFQNTRMSNFALCDYTRAHSTPLCSFAIMHAFTSGSGLHCSHSTCRNISVVSDGVSLSICIAFCIQFLHVQRQ